MLQLVHHTMVDCSVLEMLCCANGICVRFYRAMNAPILTVGIIAETYASGVFHIG